MLQGQKRDVEGELQRKKVVLSSLELDLTKAGLAIKELEETLTAIDMALDIFRPTSQEPLEVQSPRKNR